MEIEQRLVDTEAELEKHLPAALAFERFARSEKSEARIRAFLDKVFTDSGRGRGYEVECHDRICRLVVDRRVAREDWRDVMNVEPSGMGLFERRSFGRDVFLTLADTEPEPYMPLLARIQNSLLAHGKTFETCQRMHPSPGEVTFTIAWEPGTRRLIVKVSGSLAGSPLSECIRPLLESSIAVHPVPADVTEFPDVPFTVTIP